MKIRDDRKLPLIWIHREALRQLRGESSALHLYLTLIEEAEEQGATHISQAIETMAETTGLSISTVKRSLGKLIKVGMVQRQPRSGQPSEYSLTEPIAWVRNGSNLAQVEAGGSNLTQVGGSNLYQVKGGGGSNLTQVGGSNLTQVEGGGGSNLTQVSPGGGSNLTQVEGGVLNTDLLDQEDLSTRSLNINNLNNLSLSQYARGRESDFFLDREALIKFVISRNPGADRPRAYALTLLDRDYAYWVGEYQRQTAQPDLKTSQGSSGVNVPPSAPPDEINLRQAAIARVQGLAQAIGKGTPAEGFMRSRIIATCEEWGIPYPEGITPATGEKSAV